MPFFAVWFLAGHVGFTQAGYRSRAGKAGQPRVQQALPRGWQMPWKMLAKLDGKI